LLPYLRVHTHVSVLDLRGPVRAARAEGTVFARTDTHWNDRGAFAGYTAIIAHLRTWYPKMRARTRADFALLPMPRWNGDMALMLPGLFSVTAETGDHWQPLFTLTSRALPPSDYTPPSSAQFASFYGPADTDLPTAIVFHDSFLLAFDERSAAMGPYPQHSLPPPPATFRPRLLLAEQFSRSAFSWQSVFDADLVVRAQPTLVIEEVVERLLKKGPQGAVPIVNP
jgi:alginate O-acetyltransferase complex protein AlgJ